jgi:hypothetical protein
MSNFGLIISYLYIVQPGSHVHRGYNRISRTEKLRVSEVTAAANLDYVALCPSETTFRSLVQYVNEMDWK